MALSSSTSPNPAAEINVTPLIDVLLVLLIIFMVIAPILPHGLDSSVPQAAAATHLELPPVVVHIEAGAGSSGPSYNIGKQHIAFSELRPVLRQLFATRPQGTLFVDADRSLSYEQVAVVAGEAEAAGASAVVLSAGTR